MKSLRCQKSVKKPNICPEAEAPDALFFLGIVVSSIYYTVHSIFVVHNEAEIITYYKTNGTSLSSNKLTKILELDLSVTQVRILKFYLFLYILAGNPSPRR